MRAAPRATLAAHTGTVTLVDLPSVKVLLDKEPTTVTCEVTTGAMGLDVGERVILCRYGRRYTILGVLGAPIEDVPLHGNEAHTTSYEPAITSGATNQYWRGDKTWVNMPTIPEVPSLGDPVKLTLQNSWTGDLYVSKTPIGQVWLRGRIKSGTLTAGTTITTIPADYRPAERNLPMLAYMPTGAAFTTYGFRAATNGDFAIRNPASSDLSAGQSVDINTTYWGSDSGAAQSDPEQSI